MIVAVNAIYAIEERSLKKIQDFNGVEVPDFFLNFNFRSISLTKNLMLLYISHFMNTF